MVGTRWNLWRFWEYSYVGFVAAAVWNFYLDTGRDLPDQQWAFLVIMGYRNRKLFNIDDPE